MNLRRDCLCVLTALATCTVLGAGSPKAAQGQNAEVEGRVKYQRAVMALEREDFRQALRLFEEVVAVLGTSGELQYYIAFSAHEAGDVAKARTAVYKALGDEELKLFPEYNDAIRLAAEIDEKWEKSEAERVANERALAAGANLRAWSLRRIPLVDPLSGPGRTMSVERWKSQDGKCERFFQNQALVFRVKDNTSCDLEVTSVGGMAYDLSVSVRRERRDDQVYIFLWFKDRDNFLAVRLIGRYIFIKEVRDGKGESRCRQSLGRDCTSSAWTNLGDKFDYNRWHTVSVSVSEGQIVASVDGRTVRANVADWPGRSIGLGAYGKSKIHFRNLRIEPAQRSRLLIEVEQQKKQKELTDLRAESIRLPLVDPLSGPGRVIPTESWRSESGKCERFFQNQALVWRFKDNVGCWEPIGKIGGLEYELSVDVRMERNADQAHVYLGLKDLNNFIRLTLWGGHSDGRVRFGIWEVRDGTFTSACNADLDRNCPGQWQTLGQFASGQLYTVSISVTEEQIIASIGGKSARASVWSWPGRGLGLGGSGQGQIHFSDLRIEEVRK